MPREPRPPLIPLADAATAAVDTCATAFLTDQRVLPADQADERLWGPWAGHDTTIAEMIDAAERAEAAEDTER